MLDSLPGELCTILNVYPLETLWSMPGTQPHYLCGKCAFLSVDWFRVRIDLIFFIKGTLMVSYFCFLQSTTST